MQIYSGIITERHSRKQILIVILLVIVIPNRRPKYCMQDVNGRADVPAKC
jgi:hypothetical protein